MLHTQMFDPDEYQLCDFGAGRKLERFGGVLVDRPCPTAIEAPRRPEQWIDADARYERDSERSEQGRWRFVRPLPADWRVRHAVGVFSLQATPSGQVGLFPEQAEQWDWIAQECKRTAPGSAVLNLFGYAGGSTMAALCGGAFVTHVDAAKGCVQWARRNAEASKGPSPPVRWICDDARTFVRREVKRGRQYAGVILDPPSYGHGPGGEPWRLEKDLSELLDGVAALTRSSRRFVLLTCHTPGYGPVELASLIAQTMNVDRNEIESGEQSLAASDGRRLFAGTFARWSVGPRSRPNIIEA